MREWTETMGEPPDKVEGGFVYKGMIQRGSQYKDSDGNLQPFIGKDGRRYIGLLNEFGAPLQIGEPLHVLWFQKRKVVT
jgi:hypothetical protein